jgi:drug/metabolite transporter (DMT)-like permease
MLTLGSYLGASDNYEYYYFLKPMLWKGLLGFQKGWFIYTPLLLFIFPGIYFMFKRVPELKWSVIIVTIIFVYITLSWWNWWYGGSFGQKSLISLYAFLTIPVACLVSKALVKGAAIKYSFIIIITIFILMNIFQTYQFEYGSLHGDAMNSKVYFKQFGKLDKIEKFEEQLSYPNYDEAKKGNR